MTIGQTLLIIEAKINPLTFSAAKISRVSKLSKNNTFTWFSGKVKLF
jgi:hypothetical protein